MRRAVFLDRDGVLNEVRMDDARAASPLGVDDLRIVAGAKEQVDRLRAAGFLTFVITNQPDIARGRLDADVAQQINSELASAVGVDGVYLCPHDNADACTCRKPLPGMIDAAVTEHSLDRPSSWLVGDRWVDLAAGVAAGVRVVLLDSPWSWEPTSAGAPSSSLRSALTARSLTACVDLILGADAPNQSS